MNNTERSLIKKGSLLIIIFFWVFLSLPAQQKTISGRVFSAESNQPLAGARVQVKGTSEIKVTGPDGRYEIIVPEGEVLIFCYPKMVKKEQITGTSEFMDAMLETDYYGLEDTLLTGYSKQVRWKITGVVSEVKGEKLGNFPLSSFETALQGKVPSLFIEPVNGKVSSATLMRIRGTSSIFASSQPLIVVDGMPVSTETINFSGAPVNPLSTLDINDIESVEVLRDAASLAIYGSRGANGVVIVTRKKGYNGDTEINFTVQSGFSEASRRREFMNSAEYVSYLREAATNGDLMFDRYYGYPSGTIDFCRNDVETKLKTFSGWAAVLNGSGNFIRSQVSTDWQNLAFRKGKIYSADLSARGGNEKLRYYAGTSYSKQEGILISNGMEKISVRLNVENNISKLIQIGFSIGLNRAGIDQVSADNDYSSPMQLVALSPVTPPRDTNGELYSYPVTTYYNALIDTEEASKKITEYRSLANAFITLNLYRGIKWKNEIGFDLYNIKENARYGEKTMEGTGRSGYGFANYGQNQNILARSFAEYNNNAGAFNMKALLGTEYQYTTIETVYAEGERFPSDALKTLASAGLISGGSSTLTRYNFLSYFSGLDANYQGKYLLSLTGRVDGSSRFGRNNRYGFFPGLSVGWIATEENFLSGVSFLSFLKARAGYGITGNAGIGNYWHAGLYDVASYNEASGLVPGQVANPNLKWETVRQADFGIEYGFLNNRISGEINFYNKKSDGLLLNVQVPSTTGFQTQLQNRGKMENKGFEFIVSTVNFTGHLKWNTSLNLAANKNKVVSLGGQDIIDYGGDRYMNVVKPGYPLGSFYGAEYAGVDYKNGDALWYVNQQDANGNIVNQDKTTNSFQAVNFIILGSPHPSLTGSITNNLKYRNFELSFIFQGVTGNKIHLAGDQWMASNGVWYDNQLRSQLRSWKKTGDVTYVPQARLAWNNGNQSRSSRYLSDGSYLKLREIILSYEIPSEIINKINIRNLKIFIQGRNLLTFTRYEGWDPEVSADFMVNNIFSGFDFYSAPQPRSVVFGITMGL